MDVQGEISVVQVMKRKFAAAGGEVRIALQNGHSFKATVTDDGIMVDNLGALPLLPWTVFVEAINILRRNGGRAQRGDAMGSKLGDAGLSLESVEGYIAHVVYNKQVGERIFRRISPIAAILVWTGICDTAAGELILRGR
jgi:hypothetical protein